MSDQYNSNVTSKTAGNFQSEIPTNYCASIECLHPLTPEEIHTHYEYHRTNGTVAIIQSIRAARENCVKKVTTAIQGLSKEIDECDIQYIMNPEELYNQEVRKMDQCKETMFEMIEIFIDTQKKKLKSSIELNLLKVKDIGGVFSEIKEVIAQLEGLKNNLDQSNPFAYINKVCRLDVKTMLDRYKSSIKKVMTTRDLDPITVHIDDQKLFQLNSYVEKIIHVITNQEQGDIHTEESVGHQLPEEENEVSQILPDLSNVSDKNLSQRMPSKVSSQHNVSKSSKHSPAISPQIINHPTKPQPALPQPTKPQPVQAQPNTHQDDTNIFAITCQDFFEKATSPKFLHFFPDEDRILYCLDLSQVDQKLQFKFKSIQLQQNFTVPQFHRSIVTPQGQIFLSGGTLMDQSKNSMLYQFNPQSSSLDGLRVMNVGRSSHGMIYCNNCIYLISGFQSDSTLTTSFERYNLQTKKEETLADCLYPGNSPTCCVYQNKYIYKFGGNGPDDALLQIIERYDIAKNKWELLDPKLDQHEIDNFDQIPQYAACIQLNTNHIFVFGGYDVEKYGTAFSFLLNCDATQDEDNTILGTKMQNLPYPEGFQNNQVIIYNRKLYVLQNVDGPNNQFDEHNRKILCFDGNKWIDFGNGQ